MSNEALKKLFSIRPPTIEEILSQEKERETNNVYSPPISAVKRKLSSVPIIHDTLLSSTIVGKDDLTLHVAKKTRAVADPKLVPAQKRKETDNSSSIEPSVASAVSTAKKLKPSSLKPPKSSTDTTPSPPTVQKIVPTTTSSTIMSNTPTKSLTDTTPPVPPPTTSNNVQTTTSPTIMSNTPAKFLTNTPQVPLPAASNILPTAASSTMSNEYVVGRIEPKVPKKRQRKNKAAKRASKNHKDYPKETGELDFDTLLKYHEEASNKQKQSTPNNKKAVNKKPVHSQTTHVSPIVSQVANVSTVPQQQKQQRQDKPKLENKNNKNNKKFVPTVLCNYFLKGFCKQGDNCTFKHEGEPAPPPTINTVCQFFKTGSCNQGEECNFSHDLKLEPCRFFHMQGSCEQEDRCPYSHEPLNEDRLTRLRALTGPCRFFHFKGYCNTGDACLFSHNEASEEEKKAVESNILACRYYHINKSCKKGDDCFYLHDEATAEQIRKLK
ncbi:hypothetical protein HPULCUR_011190 [Helicostylum pulchrum]|uniref:C3H1-type domain-containing protein n=1 Tax=Helicostylum pulchrum TaxID=562976 RepID=A0ABP9YFD2_9FUNG